MHLHLMLLIRYYAETADGTGSLQKCFVHVEQEVLKGFWDSEFISCCAVCSL